MQQYTVPQFLDVEDKIIGPISARQFVIMMVAGLLIFIFYRLLAFSYFIIASVLFGGFAAILAFFKVNGVAFHFFLLNIIQTGKRPKLRVWLKEYTSAELRLLAIKKPEVTVKEAIPLKGQIQVSSLSELSLVVDTGGVYKGEEGSSIE